MSNSKFNAIDLFAGCGGLSEGMHKAGFRTRVAIEIDEIAARAYKMNHSQTSVLYKKISERLKLKKF